jgi:hypothetical protein
MTEMNDRVVRYPDIETICSLPDGAVIHVTDETLTMDRSGPRVVLTNARGVLYPQHVYEFFGHEAEIVIETETR